MIKIEEDDLRRALKDAWRQGNRITHNPHDLVHDEIRDIHVESILKSLTVTSSAPPAGQEEGDREQLWQNRLNAVFGHEPPQRIRVLTETVRDLELAIHGFAGSVKVERALKGKPGWTIGLSFLSVESALAMSAGELEVEMLTLVTEARRAEILAAGRAL